MNYRNLLQHEIEELEAQGCYSNDWQQVTVTDDFDPAGIHNAGFDGEVRIGSGVHIRNVGIIRTTDGATFGENVTISVQNEAGDGNLILYSGLTSQTAALMVRNVDNKPLFNKIKELVDRGVHVYLMHMDDEKRIGEVMKDTGAEFAPLEKSAFTIQDTPRMLDGIFTITDSLYNLSRPRP